MNRISRTAHWPKALPVASTSVFNAVALGIQRINRVSRPRTPSLIVKVFNKKLGVNIIHIRPITPDEPKPRMWRNRYGIWFCQQGLIQGRGTTQRGAWDDMWERKLGNCDILGGVND